MWFAIQVNGWLLENQKQQYYAKYPNKQSSIENNTQINKSQERKDPRTHRTEDWLRVKNKERLSESKFSTAQDSKMESFLY